MSLGSRIADIFSNPRAYLSPNDVSVTRAAGSRDGRPASQPTPGSGGHNSPIDMDEEVDLETLSSRAPYTHCMLAGGIGGTSGDMLMHSLDTVKTRQQGDVRIPPKYTTLGASYMTIGRQEGVFRGLYAGVTPAFLGSFPGTLIFFGVYEWSKRTLLDGGCNATLAYLAGGFLADLAASVVYVPSEVLKTRLQLQGRFNNPWFNSGYNYRGTLDAFRTIVRNEGVAALFYGYKATIFRDLPFSALQFAFYEQERALAKRWVGSHDIGLGLEILTATTAGGIAGVMTCPLDVVKTRIQTQVHEPNGTAKATATGSAAASATTTTAGRTSSSLSSSKPLSSSSSTKSSSPSSSTAASTTSSSTSSSTTRTKPKSSPSSSSSRTTQRRRSISTSSPTTTVRRATAPRFETSSVVMGLRLLYRDEGLAGWFRGVGPRAVWTSVQSGTMLVCYQVLLKKLGRWDAEKRLDEGPVVN